MVLGTSKIGDRVTADAFADLARTADGSDWTEADVVRARQLLEAYLDELDRLVDVRTDLAAHLRAADHLAAADARPSAQVTVLAEAVRLVAAAARR